MDYQVTVYNEDTHEHDVHFTGTHQRCQERAWDYMARRIADDSVAHEDIARLRASNGTWRPTLKEFYDSYPGHLRFQGNPTPYLYSHFPTIRPDCNLGWVIIKKTGDV